MQACWLVTEPVRAYRVHVQKMLTECKSDFCNVALRNGQAVQLEVTRDRFEELCQPDFQRVNKPLDRVRLFLGYHHVVVV